MCFSERDGGERGRRGVWVQAERVGAAAGGSAAAADLREGVQGRGAKAGGRSGRRLGTRAAGATVPMFRVRAHVPLAQAAARARQGKHGRPQSQGALPTQVWLLLPPLQDQAAQPQVPSPPSGTKFLISISAPFGVKVPCF